MKAYNDSFRYVFLILFMIFVSLVSLIAPWPIFVLPTFFLTEHPQGVYIAWGFVTIYALLLAIIYFLRFRQGKWKTMSVIQG